MNRIIINDPLWIWLALYLMIYLLLIIHECGHIIASKWVGNGFKYVEFGMGRKLIKWRKIQLNKGFFIPIAIVRPKPYSEKFRKRGIFLSGGMFIVLMVWVLGYAIFRGSQHPLFTIFNRSALFVTVVAVIPIPLSNGLPSDGLQLIQLWKKRKAELEIEEE